MLCCPARSPRSRSSRLPGGTRRSSSPTAASSIRSFRRATLCTSGPNRLIRCRSKSRSASRSRKLLITPDSNAARYYSSSLRSNRSRTRRGSGSLQRTRPVPSVLVPGPIWGQVHVELHVAPVGSVRLYLRSDVLARVQETLGEAEGEAEVLGIERELGWTSATNRAGVGPAAAGGRACSAPAESRKPAAHEARSG